MPRTHSIRRRSILMTFLATVVLLFYQNCGQPFQSIEATGVIQNSSLSGLPPANSFNGELDLAWDPTTLNEDNTAASIRGYKIYIRNSNNSFNRIISENEVGNFTDHRVTGLTSGETYNFAVSAISTDGIESNRSAEIAYTAP